MNALIEEEMKMNLIRRMKHLLSPMNPHLWSYPFSLISAIYFYEQIPHSHLQFCNLFSVIYFQSFNSSIYFSVIYIPAILFSATLNPNSGFAQLEHSSN